MRDPLGEYPEMMSTKDLADFLSIGYNTARVLMKSRLPAVEVGVSKNHSSLRIPKEYVRKKYITDIMGDAAEISKN